MEKKEENKGLPIITINVQNVRKLFDESINVDFRKYGPGAKLIGQTLYVLASGDNVRDRYIAGSVVLDDVIVRNNLHEIIEATSHFKIASIGEITNYYGRNYGDENRKCYALCFDKITGFEPYLPWPNIKKIAPNFEVVPYIQYVKRDNPLYWTITEWDKIFALDGSGGYVKNKSQEINRIMQEAISRRPR